MPVPLTEGQAEMKKKMKQMVVLLLTVVLLFGNTSGVTQVQGATIKTIKKKEATGTYKGWVSASKLSKIKYKKGLTISWKKVKKAKKYQVEVYRYSPVRIKWVSIKKKTAKKASYLLTNVDKGVEYKIRIRSYKNKSYSKWSKKFTVKPRKDYYVIKTDKNHNPVESAKMDRFAAEEAFMLQNKLRKDAGVSEIQWDENLYKICEIRAKQLSKDFSHNVSTVCSYFGNGYDGVKLGGENIASGYETPQKAMNGWKNSNGHYNALKNVKWKTGAIASYYSGEHRYWVAIFEQYTSEELLELNEKYGKVKLSK